MKGLTQTAASYIQAPRHSGGEQHQQSGATASSCIGGRMFLLGWGRIMTSILPMGCLPGLIWSRSHMLRYYLGASLKLGHFTHMESLPRCGRRSLSILPISREGLADFRQ